MTSKSPMVIIAIFVATITAITDVASASPRSKPAPKNKYAYSAQVDPATGTVTYIPDGIDDICVIARKKRYNPFTGYPYWKKYRKCYSY